MPRNPPHAGTLHKAFKRLLGVLPAGWDIRSQSAVRLGGSEPEPDLAVVREDPVGYSTRHPAAADVGLVIEVSDSTLAGDRADKGRIYARAGIPFYWIVNVVNTQVEVYTTPGGSDPAFAYAQRQDHGIGDSVGLTLNGNAILSIPVRDLFP
jgi:Uma2 family endonuclease